MLNALQTPVVPPASELLREVIARHRRGQRMPASVLARIDPGSLQEIADITNLGVLWRGAGEPRQALACYQLALGRGDRSPALWLNMGNALKDLKRCAEAALCHRKAAELTPDSVLAWHNYGIALRAADQPAEAVEALARALALPHDDTLNSEWDLALALLSQGRYSEGWRHYGARWRQPGHTHPYPTGATWDGQPLRKGKSLLLWGEQGFGDVIHSLRFLECVLPRTQAGKLTVALAPELLSLAQASYPGVEFVARNGGDIEFDLQASILDLPGLLMKDDSDIPAAEAYLRPPAGENPFRHRLAREGGCLHVGLVWSGSVTFAANADRALPGRMMMEFLGRAGVRFYALQKGPPQRETAALQAEYGVLDWSGWLGDFGDTAQAVEALDLVIMTDSSVAHLCGAMDKEVWVLLSKPAHWLWQQEGSDTPWYRSLRLFRQSAPGHWLSALDCAATALAERLEQRRGNVAGS